MAKGLAVDRVWFSGGRTGATLLGHGGLGEILYYGAQEQGGHTFFRTGSPESAWEKLFRLCVVIDGTAWYPEFTSTRLYPLGYSSECELAGVRFRHKLTLSTPRWCRAWLSSTIPPGGSSPSSSSSTGTTA